MRRFRLGLRRVHAHKILLAKQALQQRQRQPIRCERGVGAVRRYGRAVRRHAGRGIHPHNRARGTFQQVDGFMQPAPAPRFSRTPSQMGVVPIVGEHNESAFQSWGIDN